MLFIHKEQFLFETKLFGSNHIAVGKDAHLIITIIKEFVYVPVGNHRQFLASIFYLVDSFCLYAVSAAPARVMEAEQNEEEETENEEKAAPAEAMQRVERAVKQWMASGGHLKSGLKLPNAAEEMQIPRYLLSVWLRQTGRHYNEWLAELRIDEAKRTLREHPEWSNEAVAMHCGFNDRCYFQKVFKEMTGMTPAQYIITQSR